MMPRGPRPAFQAVALHGVALAILLWPLVGIVYVPMVDLPGHLAITRVLGDVLHGQHRHTLQLNVDPVHKPTYVLLYAVFALLPKAVVGPVAAGLLVAACYAAVCVVIAALGKRAASSPPVVALALLVGMFCYSSAFFWGLIPFLLSMPPALLAFGAYLQASGVTDGAGPAPSRAKGRALAFLAAALLAHVVHPLASFFLAIMVAGAAAAGVAFALVPRGTAARAAPARLWSVAGPLVVWVLAVATLHLLTAPPGHERDLARSAPALAAPFHGLAAARAFLAQMPIELDMLPIRNPAATRVAYPIAVGLLLAGAWIVALVGSRLPRSTPRTGGSAAMRAPSPAARLATVFVLCALLLLFLRHDLVRISGRALWFPVRAPDYLVFFFGALAAALILRSMEPGRGSRLVTAVLVTGALALAGERSAVLRTHFVAFDGRVRAFFAGELPDRWFRSQPFGYVDHIRVYNCYFDAVCNDHRSLFFAIYPDATIYPVSRVRPPAGAE